MMLWLLGFSCLSLASSPAELILDSITASLTHAWYDCTLVQAIHHLLQQTCMIIIKLFTTICRAPPPYKCHHHLHMQTTTHNKKSYHNICCKRGLSRTYKHKKLNNNTVNLYSFNLGIYYRMPRTAWFLKIKSCKNYIVVSKGKESLIYVDKIKG